MTPERARAYGSVMRMLRVLGPSKLRPAEREFLRTAADMLVFADGDGQDQDAQVMLDSLTGFAGALLASGHWSRSQVRWLIDDVCACGPENPLERTKPGRLTPGPAPLAEAATSRYLERAAQTTGFDS